MKYIGFKTFLLSSLLLLNGCGGGGGSTLIAEIVESDTTDSRNSTPTGTASTGNLIIIPAPENTIPVVYEKMAIVDSGQTVNIELSATDGDGDALTYHIVSSPLYGTLTGSAANRTYASNAKYSGLDSFTYSVNDGTADAIAVKVNIVVVDNSLTRVNISGRVTYDLVPAKSNKIGLDYNNIVKAGAKFILIEAIDENDYTLTSTVSDEQGDYNLSVPVNTKVKVRVRAQMRRADTVLWDVKVLDNTHSDALYVMEDDLIDTGTLDSVRNLNARSGWGINSYTGDRVAAPFAMLDTVYSSMEKIITADAEAVFPPLLINWSIDNKAAVGDPANGDITTSYYSNGNLFILGDENSDTDEYDDHVIAHEWAHYYEDKFSRSDSIGGSHGAEDKLDIRVAFGEGWGNAFSAIALNAPIYFDTYGPTQRDGFNFNMETESSNASGWYSEGSIQRILYDLYDSSNDGSDTINLGFTPLHQVFTGAQKTTEVFSSIFSFIRYLKDENPAEETEISSIVASENIATITDIYGNNRRNLSEETPLYVDLIVGDSVNVCPGYAYGRYNKLGNRKYIRFNINSTGNYSISVKNSTGSSRTDPDFMLHNVSNHTLTYLGEDAAYSVETQSMTLERASYMLDVYDYESISGACFSVSVH
jgi:hypothetical protein